jgi:hypothetical protein
VKTPISAWGLDEFSAYIGFRQAPAPLAIRKPGVRRGSPGWRPFLGPLTDRSAGQTRKLSRRCSTGCATSATCNSIRPPVCRRAGRREPEKQGRFLSPDDTALLREAIAGWPARNPAARRAWRGRATLFAVDLFERTGLRTTEVVQCRMGHVRIEPVAQALKREFPDAPPFLWLLRVERGKGGKGGKARWGDLRGIRSRTAIWKVVTRLCSETLAYVRAHGRLVDAERFERASTHWVRHPYAKGLAQAVHDGQDASAALENMGHSDLRTFRQCVDDEPLKRALPTQLARARAIR